jgi:uncharacterized Zn-finger protein
MAVNGNTPKFHNQLAVREIRIGVREFNCVGVLPPHDHPHIYLAMEHRSLCPYCSTLFVFDERLAPTETDQQAVILRSKHWDVRRAQEPERRRLAR